LHLEFSLLESIFRPDLILVPLLGNAVKLGMSLHGNQKLVAGAGRWLGALSAFGWLGVGLFPFLSPFSRWRVIGERF
jgi:hypothetical protein